MTLLELCYLSHQEDKILSLLSHISCPAAFLRKLFPLKFYSLESQDVKIFTVKIIFEVTSILGFQPLWRKEQLELVSVCCKMNVLKLTDMNFT